MRSSSPGLCEAVRWGLAIGSIALLVAAVGCRHARAGGSSAPMAPSPESGRSTDGPTTFSGFAEVLGVGFASRATDRDSRGSGWATLFARQSASIGPVTLVGAVRAQKISWPAQSARHFDWIDRAIDRSPVSLREASATIRLAPAVDLSIGKFVTSWSWVDGYSPADAFAPRDLTDPFADERLPLWGAHLQGERGALRVEAYASFMTTPWRLPRLDGRYSPFGGARIFAERADSPVPRRGFQMARVLHSGRRWDVGGWARTGVRPAPILSTFDEIARPAAADIFLSTQRHFARETAVGIELAREVAGWNFRGEAAVFQSSDAMLGDAVIASAEAERLVRSGALTFTLAGNFRETPVDPLLLFDRAYLPLFAIGSVQLESWGSWEIQALGTIRRIGGVLRAELTRPLTDAIAMTLGTRLPYGTPFDSPGAFRHARQLRTSVRWSW